MPLWRLTRAKHLQNCLHGMEASTVGGRWNPKGLRVIYTSETRALSILEMLVHADSDLMPRDYLFVEVVLPEAARVLRVEDFAALPADWRQYPFGTETQEIGRSWVGSAKSAVLSVPSAVVPEERNYVINLGHPDAASMRVGQSSPVDWDKRLFRP